MQAIKATLITIIFLAVMILSFVAIPILAAIGLFVIVFFVLGMIEKAKDK